MKMLTKYFDTHLDELKTFLSTNDILAIEAIIKTFESSPPDWEFILARCKTRGFGKAIY